MMMTMTEEGVRLTEAAHVPDTFVSGLGEVEDIGGGCYRFTFYSRQTIGDREELVVVAKLVAPREAVPPAVILAAKAVGCSLVTSGFFPTGMN